MNTHETLAVLRDQREHPERWPGGVRVEVLARNDWALLKAWRERRGVGA